MLIAEGALTLPDLVGFSTRQSKVCPCKGGLSQGRKKRLHQIYSSECSSLHLLWRRRIYCLKRNVRRIFFVQIF